MKPSALTTDEHREYCHLRRIAFPERAKEISFKYRSANREKTRARTRRWYAENKESALARKKVWRKLNPNYTKYHRVRNWKVLQIINRNGTPFSHDDYDIMFAFQNGSCAICGKHQSELRSTLAVDHNHKTGKARGLLCNGCNLRIIAFEDKDFVEKCRRYIACIP